jgi:hypothetical protein
MWTLWVTALATTGATLANTIEPEHGCAMKMRLPSLAAIAA